MHPLLIFKDRPFTTAQDSAAGIGDDALLRAVRRGRVRRLHHGVYVRGDVPDTLHLRVLAAVATQPEGLIVSHETAADLWGVDVSLPRAPRAPRSAEVRGLAVQGPGCPATQGCDWVARD